MIKEFKECDDNRHDYAKEWKKKTDGLANINSVYDLL